MKFEVRNSKFEGRLVLLLPLGILAAITGCKVGPDYKRPVVDTPTSYKTATTDTNHSVGPKSLGDIGWWEVFQDQQLTEYINETLTQNWDVKIAAARVIQAEGALKLARSQFFPTINAGGNLYTTRSSQRGPVP